MSVEPIRVGREFTDAEVSFLETLAGLSYAEGDILYYDGSNLNRLPRGSNGEVLTLASGIPSWAAAAGGIGGSTGGTDNAILRADGVGGSTLQSSGVTINDSDAVSGVSSLVLDASGSLLFGAVTILSDSAGTTTLSNIDALDATTEATIEAAIDTLANLTSATSLATVGTITTGTWEATDVGVAHGGTGASTAGDARTNLGLVIGTDVQGFDAGLASIAGLTTAADRMIYTTASDTYAVATLTSFARTILDDADAGTVRTTIGAGTGNLDNVVEDTTPQLGGNLDTNSFNIEFDDDHGIFDDSSNGHLLFQKTASAVNYFEMTNAATAGTPLLSVAGSDANIDLELQAKGTGVVEINDPKITLGSDATGDIFYRNSSGNIARLAIGSTDQVLTVASGLPSWAAPAGGGGASSLVSAYKSSNQTSITGSITKITFTSENFDTGGDFASSTYTAPSAGKYVITAKIRATNMTGNDFWNVHLRKNGTTIEIYAAGPENDISTTSSNGSTARELTFTTLLDLASSDTLDLHTESGDTSYTITGGAATTQNRSHFQIYRIAD